MVQTIDFVVSWVNSNDKRWQLRKNQMLHKMNLPTLMVGEDRYHDYGFFKYWFRSIEKYAPWVHHVYLITDQQKPDFFMESEKVSIVDHSEFIPNEYLPTFSSSVIELYLDQIPNIANNFVYFNDDMLLNSPVEPSDFFSTDGFPLDMAVPAIIEPHVGFDHLPFNNSFVLNKYFNKKKVLRENWKKFCCLKYGIKNLTKLFLTLPFEYWSSFQILHIPYSLSKNDYNRLRNYAIDEMKRTSEMHFRSNYDINIWLLQELRFMTGDFLPRSFKAGSFFTFDMVDDLIDTISKESISMICINDDSKELDLSEKEIVAKKIINALKSKFPNKSLNEK